LWLVTGVQTCALPILMESASGKSRRDASFTGVLTGKGQTSNVAASRKPNSVRLRSPRLTARRASARRSFLSPRHCWRGPATDPEASDGPSEPAPEDAGCLPIWSCSVRGFACHRPYGRRGALLPHLFTLTHRRPSGYDGRYIFCATFLQVALTGRYPAHCPAEFGLSSHLRPPGYGGQALRIGAHL